ncbi:unnamed protein product [Protopolystoma xenopodis]|uniref:Uncharacterized protein n=1 Tax=Protopolystoma xenopodis TaxID=117903 RepID=A0A3S5AVM5_9PLAT|nr:unnamed protein product [Protopolystoma xenopodis]
MSSSRSNISSKAPTAFLPGIVRAETARQLENLSLLCLPHLTYPIRLPTSAVSYTSPTVIDQVATLACTSSASVPIRSFSSQSSSSTTNRSRNSIILPSHPLQSSSTATLPLNSSGHHSPLGIGVPEPCCRMNQQSPAVVSAHNHLTVTTGTSDVTGLLHSTGSMDGQDRSRLTGPLVYLQNDDSGLKIQSTHAPITPSIDLPCTTLSSTSTAPAFIIVVRYPALLEMLVRAILVHARLPFWLARVAAARPVCLTLISQCTEFFRIRGRLTGAIPPTWLKEKFGIEQYSILQDEYIWLRSFTTSIPSSNSLEDRLLSGHLILFRTICSRLVASLFLSETSLADVSSSATSESRATSGQKCSLLTGLTEFKQPRHCTFLSSPLSLIRLFARSDNQLAALASRFQGRFHFEPSTDPSESACFKEEAHQPLQAADVASGSSMNATPSFTTTHPNSVFASFRAASGDSEILYTTQGSVNDADDEEDKPLREDEEDNEVEDTGLAPPSCLEMSQLLCSVSVQPPTPLMVALCLYQARKLVPLLLVDFLFPAARFMLRGVALAQFSQLVSAFTDPVNAASEHDIDLVPTSADINKLDDRLMSHESDGRQSLPFPGGMSDYSFHSHLSPNLLATGDSINSSPSIGIGIEPSNLTTRLGNGLENSNHQTFGILEEESNVRSTLSASAYAHPGTLGQSSGKVHMGAKISDIRLFRSPVETSNSGRSSQSTGHGNITGNSMPVGMEVVQRVGCLSRPAAQNLLLFLAKMDLQCLENVRTNGLHLNYLYLNLLILQFMF